jgi:CheY-like chemotaxis protein
VINPPSRKSLGVLVADHEDMLRGLLRRLRELVPGVEVVGEAVDGYVAVELVQSTDPDLVLLDIEMPRLDGLAAELIRSFRPQTRVLLHSSSVGEERQRQAAALGLSILGKRLLKETVGVVETAAGDQPLIIEPLVLLALADRDQEGALVIRADETILFYNGAAASLLRLPWPSERLTLADLRERLSILDEDGITRGIERLPLARALAERVPTAAAVVVQFPDDGARHHLRMTSLPFFDPVGEFLGVGSYLIDRRAG